MRSSLGFMFDFIAGFSLTGGVLRTRVFGSTGGGGGGGEPSSSLEKLVPL